MAVYPFGFGKTTRVVPEKSGAGCLSIFSQGRINYKNFNYMKRLFVIASMILMLPAVKAQPETVYAFLAHGSTVDNVYAAFGQPFFEQIPSANYEVAYSVAQAQIVPQDITDEVCANEDYTKHGYNIPAPHAVGTIDGGEAYVVHGHELGYDLLNNLSLTVNPIYEVEITKMYHGTYPLGPDGVTPIHDGENIFNLQTMKGCDSIVTIIASLCPETATDADNTDYNTVVVANYCWTHENMSTTHYAECSASGQTAGGEVENMVYSSTMSSSEAENLGLYGRLYTWEAATGTVDPSKDFIQGICPCGWHIPTLEEAQALESLQAEALRSTNLWFLPNNNTDETGFTARPAGFYNSALTRFEDMGSVTYYWSEAPAGSSQHKALKIPYYCDHMEIVDHQDVDAVSVRCVLDYEK